MTLTCKVGPATEESCVPNPVAPATFALGTCNAAALLTLPLDCIPLLCSLSLPGL